MCCGVPVCRHALWKTAAILYCCWKHMCCTAKPWCFSVIYVNHVWRMINRTTPSIPCMIMMRWPHSINTTVPPTPPSFNLSSPIQIYHLPLQCNSPINEKSQEEPGWRLMCAGENTRDYLQRCKGEETASRQLLSYKTQVLQNVFSL